jgi:hypothetical protein
MGIMGGDSVIRTGRDRPDIEFLGLGVVIHGREALVWSTTIKHGPLRGSAMSAATVRDRPEGHVPA